MPFTSVMSHRYDAVDESEPELAGECIGEISGAQYEHWQELRDTSIKKKRYLCRMRGHREDISSGILLEEVT